YLSPLKHTSKSNPDHGALEKSLNSIKEVMTYIRKKEIDAYDKLTSKIFPTFMDCFVVFYQIASFPKFLLTLVTSVIFTTFVNCPFML
ncbi:unnamed protein product, partial [Trichogramma brassicae]